MIFTESKRNVSIGVLCGIIAGFVLGIFFGYPGSEPLETSKGNAAGDIVGLARAGKFRNNPVTGTEKAECDTLVYEATGSDGENLKIMLIKK